MRTSEPELETTLQEKIKRHEGRQKNQIELSVVIPIYQEQDVIPDLIPRLVQVLNQMGLRYEIIAVDDGSQDGTPAALQELHRQLQDKMQLLIHPYNKGLGASLKTGMRAASGEIIAWLDGDGQHDPSDLVRMYPYTNEYDLVVGVRTQDYKGPRHRNLANRFYNLFASSLADFKIEDLTSGYRLFKASLIKRYLHMLPARFSSSATTTLAFIKGGYSIKYVPVNFAKRQGGTSKINIFQDGWRFLLIILKIAVIFEPLRVFSPIALLSFILAIISTLLSMGLERRLIIPNSAVLLFVLSILVLLLGLIAEQVAVLQISTTSEVDIGHGDDGSV